MYCPTSNAYAIKRNVFLPNFADNEPTVDDVMPSTIQEMIKYTLTCRNKKFLCREIKQFIVFVWNILLGTLDAEQMPFTLSK